MSRKRTRRRMVVPMPPPGLRPKLSRDQVADLSLAHIVNLDSIARGEATEELLWQWAGGVLTWLRAAQLLGEGEVQMDEQCELVGEVVRRYGRTGKILFTGPEYQRAKTGTIVMDLLAERVDRATALQAADWGEAQMNALAASLAKDDAPEGRTAGASDLTRVLFTDQAGADGTKAQPACLQEVATVEETRT